MHIRRSVRVGLMVVALAVSGILQPVEALVRPRALGGQVAAPGVLGAGVVTAALRARGTVVRRASGTTVERVRVRVGRQAPTTLYRVTVEGRFPPRAERYALVAGGRVVAYASPTPNERAVRAITADPTVVGAPVEVRYEGGRTSIAPGRALVTGGAGRAASRAARRLGVTRAVYKLGERAFQPSDVGAKVELTADVHYPTTLDGGPYPLVLFMHGNHSTCYRGSRTRFEWPCRRGWRPLPNFTGYDYIARRLAARGFIVVSVSANGVNVVGSRVDDTGMRQRGEVLEKHIDLWRRWSTRGGKPFGDTFVGQVDLSVIGTMGHSRGGEGVVWHKIVDEERQSPYGIDAVLALAPVDFTRATINRVPFAVVLPYCDGDVYDLQGVHFFDDSRYAVPGDPTPKHTVTAFRANHNFFNTVWSPSGGFPGAFDDGRWSNCKHRLTQREQRRVGRVYVVGFFRRYLADRLELDDMWTGATTPSRIEPARTLVSYLAPDTPGRRLDIARFTHANDLFENERGGSVTARGMSLLSWCANTWRTPCVPGEHTGTDIHLPGLAQGVLGWSDHSGVVRFDIPPGEGDVRALDALQFRAAMNPAYLANGGIRYQDLSVELIDGQGERASVTASEVGNEALAAPKGRRRSRAHVIVNQVRFPLRLFAGVDLGDVRAVRLRFSRTASGVIDIADVAFSRGGR